MKAIGRIAGYVILFRLLQRWGIFFEEKMVKPDKVNTEKQCRSPKKALKMSSDQAHQFQNTRATARTTQTRLTRSGRKRMTKSWPSSSKVRPQFETYLACKTSDLFKDSFVLIRLNDPTFLHFLSSSVKYTSHVVNQGRQWLHHLSHPRPE